MFDLTNEQAFDILGHPERTHVRVTPGFYGVVCRRRAPRRGPDSGGSGDRV